MAEYWDKNGNNYAQSTVIYAETTTGKEWDLESVVEMVPEIEHILELEDGLRYDDLKYFRDKFDQEYGEEA